MTPAACEHSEKRSFLAPPQKAALGLASRPPSLLGAPREDGRRKGEKTNDRANPSQTNKSRAIQGTDSQPPAIPEWNEQKALEALKIERVPFESLDGNTQ
jgi:hypothetical protein